MKKCFPRSFFLSLLLFTAFFGCEQDTEAPLTFGKLIGNITSEDGLPISNATVRISSSKFTETVETNASGNYIFEKVPTGSIELSVNADYFIGVTESFLLKENIVNERDISLKLGEARLEVSTELIRATVVSGNSTLGITSNTSWTITNTSPWISLSPTESKGNQTVTINWDAQEGETEREAIIEIKAGNISKAVKIQQPLPAKIVEINPFFGNTLKEKSQGFELVFSGPVTIEEIRNLYFYCQPPNIPFQYNDQKNRVTFTYTCGRIGGEYPFLVVFKDEFGNSYNQNIDVGFFDQELNFEGYIQSGHTMSGEDRQWILTKEPNKIYLIDLQKLEILKSFNLGNFRLRYLSHNPFNNQLYIATEDGKLLVVNPDNGNVINTIDLPEVPFQESENYYVNSMVFNLRGFAFIEVYQTGSSGQSWFIMDSANGHKIYRHPDYGWDSGQFYHALYPKVSVDQKNIYFYGPSSDIRRVVKMDEQAENWTTITEITDRASTENMIKSRKDDKLILDHNGDIQILEGEEEINLGVIGYSLMIFDFCYTCPNPKTILLVDRRDQIFGFYDYAGRETTKRYLAGGGGQWMNILNTLDGKHLIVETDDYGYDPQTGHFTAKMLRIRMDRFE
jgi:hypothetical protein